MKLKIVGDAYVAISTITVEQINICKKYAPDALKLYDKDGNEEFAINYVEGGKPTVAKFGVVFTGKTRDGSDCITLTKTLPADTSDAKSFVAEEFGKVMINIAKLEESVPTKAAELSEAKSNLIASIIEE